MMNRRDVLHMAVTVGAAAAIRSGTAQAAPAAARQFSVVDTNVSLFRWPFRRLPCDDPASLVQKLSSLSVSQAWTGSYEGLLQRDMAAVNQRLASACRDHSELIPFGSVNPALPGWDDDLRRCVDEHHMPGIRLHPSYHGYPLNDSRFIQLLEWTATRRVLVQIAASMEDTRTQHPLLQVADVDLTPLVDVLSGLPDARVQVLNARPRSPLIDQFAPLQNVYFDTARVDGTDGVPQLIRRLPAGRVLFGSHAPFLIPEAALIRVHESGQLDAAELNDVYTQNATKLLQQVTT